jgi:hypothetical protein
MNNTFTPVEAAPLLKCSPDHVRALCVSGRLVATNISMGKKRARWVIHQNAIEAFLNPQPLRTQARRRAPATSRRWN